MISVSIANILILVLFKAFTRRTVEVSISIK